MFAKKNKSAYTNFLTARYERLTGSPIVHSHPYYMALDPSTICQLKCPSCPTGIENESRATGGDTKYRDRSLMSEEMFESLIEELGEYLFMVLFYNWGEPLLNKKLPSFVRRAKGYDIFTEIHTNLSLKLKDEFIEEVLSSGIDRIAASIDGFSQESYETYRRGGDFELAKENIVRFARTRDRLGLATNIRWNFLTFSFNEHEVEAARKFCEENALEFNRREAYIDNPDWLPSHRKQEADKLSKSGNPAEGAERHGSSRGSCEWLYGYSIVNSDGSVSPCCAPFDQETDFGKVVPGKMGFMDVWNNNYYRKSRAVFAGKTVKELSGIETICENCKFGPVQDLYRSFDNEIRACFDREMAGKDPVLDKAFGLLDSENAFVDYFSRNLAGMTGSSTPDESGRVKLLRKELDDVYSSKSWKLTYPLRYISAKLKGVKPKK